MRKKIYFSILLLLAVFGRNIEAQTGNWINFTTAYTETGRGIETNPIEITNARQLAYLTVKVNAGTDYSGKYFKVTADIDLGEHYWTPISGFSGIFDGNGKEIKNLIINAPDVNAQGLFGSVFSATIKNIFLTDCNIIGGNSVGAIAGGANFSNISGCYVDGRIVGKNIVGGICGNASEMVILSENYVTGSVTGTSNIGGIVGSLINALGGSVKFCYSSAVIVASAGAAGGIAGEAGVRNSNAVINSVACGTSVSGDPARRIVGSLQSLTYLSGNYALSSMTVNGAVIANGASASNDTNGESKTLNELYEKPTYTTINWDFVNTWQICMGTTFPYFKRQIMEGGCVHKIRTRQNLEILNDYLGPGNSSVQFELANDIDLGTTTWVPIGNTVAAGADVSKYFYGQLNGNGYAVKNLKINNTSGRQGLFRELGSTAKIENLSIVGCSVKGGGDVGALVGYNEGNIINCRATGSISGTGNIGGLIGTNYSGVVSQCSAATTVNGSSSFVGGLIGDNLSSVSQCYAAGTVTGTGGVGGLIGRAYIKAAVSECYAVGSVTGTSNIGGLIGVIAGDYQAKVGAKVSDCYAAGSVTGFPTAGGLAGSVGEYASVSRCYATGAVPGGGIEVGNFIGSNRGTVSLCFIDRMSTGLPTIIGYDYNGQSGNITDKTTDEFTTAVLPNDFSADKWQAVVGYYPQLKVFSNSDDAGTKNRSALSTVPLKLSGTEDAAAVKSVFDLYEKTASGQAIEWSVSPSASADIINGKVSSRVGSWYELTLKAGDDSRVIKYKPAQSFSVGIVTLQVGNNIFENPAKQGKFSVDCESSEDLVTVKVKTSKLTAISPSKEFTVSASVPGIYPNPVNVTTADNVTETYDISIERPFGSDIFVQRWSDVLAVNNNQTTNGGYIFTGYKWYKNGNDLNITDGYIQESGGLNKSAEYTAELTAQQGAIHTCPAEVTDVKVKMAVWPNPARCGQIVRLETDIPLEELGKAYLQLFDQTGNIMRKTNLRNTVTDISVPDIPGQYLLQITVNGVGQTFKIIAE